MTGVQDPYAQVGRLENSPVSLLAFEMVLFMPRSKFKAAGHAFCPGRSVSALHGSGNKLQPVVCILLASRTASFFLNTRIRFGPRSVPAAVPQARRKRD
jgi:hypothetical protein